MYYIPLLRQVGLSSLTETQFYRVLGFRLWMEEILHHHEKSKNGNCRALGILSGARFPPYPGEPLAVRNVGVCGGCR